MKVSLRILFFILIIPAVAWAQPYNDWLVVSSGHGYLSTPSSPDLNTTTGFTFEAWVSVKDAGGCSSIAGKNYTQAWWVGICGTTFRSYLRGTSSQFNGGTVPAGVWTHVAVTYDGVTHKHYIDGELVASRAETGAMTTSSDEMRIFSDTAWQHSPQPGAIDEVRIWSVARTADQIRSAINTPITAPQPGLIALYHLDANGNDSAGSHTAILNGTAGFLNAPIGGLCGANTTTLCFEGGNFGVTVRWTKSDGTSGDGVVVPGASSNSGLFWFFDPADWELLVKELNGCPVNGQRWLFSAATTNVHYNATVTDFHTGAQRHYFNYQGINAPAVNDTSAFTDCP